MLISMQKERSKNELKGEMWRSPVESLLEIYLTMGQESRNKKDMTIQKEEKNS